MESSMKTLVTGATGLVGNNVVRLLADRQQPVRVLVRAGRDPRPLEGLDVEIVEGDVRDEPAVRRACSGVDRIVHSAAHVFFGWSGLAEQRAINVTGTCIVADAARSCGARMVHVSSVDALGLGTSQNPADESTPRGGKTTCPYVVTKTEAEDVLRAQIDRGLDAVIVNPAFMIGPWDWKPSSGRMLLEVGRRFAPLAPSGGCSICDVRDVAAGILVALERGTCGRNYILAGFNLTYFNIWTLFARVAGQRPPWGRLGPVLRYAVGAAGDLLGRVAGREPVINSASLAMSSLYHYYSSARAQAELDYHNRPLTETVQEAWSWFKNRGYA
jgi:dihydroflavonol-4-reductase